MTTNVGRHKLQQVKLRGFERMLTTVDGVSMKIVHSMLVAGDAEALVQFVPVALMRTFNLHPRMRALQVKGKDFMAEIQAPITLDDIARKNLLRVQRFSKSSEDSFDNWQQYAEGECNIGFNRYSQLPFFLMVWIDEKAEQARLMLFSDHYMSDGYSGMVVLNCILELVATLSAHESRVDQDNQLQAFPLHSSFYDMWVAKKPLSKALMKGVISLLGKTIYRSEMKKFKPVLPARDDQHDFVVPPISNPTSASFAQGDPSCMNKALAKCKDERVTFGGAVVCATVLAFYHAAKTQPDFSPEEPFKLVADLDYNMRRRVPCPAEEDQVGAYVAFGNLESFTKQGLNLKTVRFWDLARRAKREIDGILRQTLTLSAVPIIMDQRINAKITPSFAKALNILHSQTSDANLSNVGRYPYAKEHLLVSKAGEKTTLTVKSLHVYNPIPHLGPSAVLFVSSVDSFCYAMGHKCEDDAAKSLFSAWVAISEYIGDIGTDDTLAGVLEQLNL
ncbi:unnamed protein product [Phytophthora lilii]|uniref:Unnamed protein product n=1 Tax=Phytophthora lilii TaxID=2077276 RepID=A0A9W6TYV1_9STRA|nr:unnamed protein product [Phytophthora lilii]